MPQRLMSREAIDNWFEHKTKNLNNFQKAILRKRVLVALSDSLKVLGLKGLGATSLKLARQFYTVFGQIGQKASDQCCVQAGEFPPTAAARHAANAQSLLPHWLVALRGTVDH